ncbi:GNAT family N-acetyltransferase [Pedobacter sp. GR22-6]|uniref:GNAT family N-acetyltransferase n=1 Tax=Pedobacter sp. GR22-6 TaxID=3127957 RepID=UPI00307E8595
MIQPISFENEKFLIHSFRPQDLHRFNDLALEVFSILSDDHTLRYLPAKRLDTLHDAEQFLQGMLLNFYAGRNYLHFISDKKTGKVVGMIDLISPELAREHYHIDRYPFFLEFYLSSFASGCYLMTELLPPAVEQLLNQGIAHIAAVVNKENIAAKKVLKKARFQKKQAFDVQQDFYEVRVA